MNKDVKILCNAITEALRECEAHPEDSVQDIFNEALSTWETGLFMTSRYEIDTE